MGLKTKFYELRHEKFFCNLRLKISVLQFCWKLCRILSNFFFQKIRKTSLWLKKPNFMNKGIENSLLVYNQIFSSIKLAENFGEY